MMETGTDTVAGRTLNLARGIAARHALTGEIGPCDALVQAGLDSMDLVNLMLAVEAEFDLTIPGSCMNPQNFRSVESIAKMIEQVRSGTLQ